MVESFIVALAVCTSPAQGWSAPPVMTGETGVYACLPYFQIPATRPVRCPIYQTLLTQRSFALTPVGLGPFIDMDNRRRDEDEAKKRQRDAELREQARRNEAIREPSRNYGYVSPPSAHTQPQELYYNPDTGHYEYREYQNRGQSNYQSPAYYYPSNEYDPGNAYYYLRYHYRDNGSTAAPAGNAAKMRGAGGA